MPFWFQILFNFNRQTIEIEHGTRLLKLTFLKIFLFIFILRYICLRIYMYLKQLNVVYYPTAFLLPQPINPSSFYNLRNSNKSTNRNQLLVTYMYTSHTWPGGRTVECRGRRESASQYRRIAQAHVMTLYRRRCNPRAHAGQVHTKLRDYPYTEMIVK